MLAVWVYHWNASSWLSLRLTCGLNHLLHSLSLAVILPLGQQKSPNQAQIVKNTGSQNQCNRQKEVDIDLVAEPSQEECDQDIEDEAGDKYVVTELAFQSAPDAAANAIQSRQTGHR